MGNFMLYMFYLVGISFVIMAIAITIDKLLTPLWNAGNIIADIVYKKMKF